MIFHRVLAGIQLLLLIGIAAWELIATPSNPHDYVILFWAWWALTAGSKIMLIAWKIHFRRLSGFSLLAFIAYMIMATIVVQTTTEAYIIPQAMIPLSNAIGAAIAIVICFLADFFYWRLPLPGLNVPVIDSPDQSPNAH